MAYEPFDPSHPDYQTDNGEAIANWDRRNQRALRDAVVLDAFALWDVVVVGNDVGEPDYTEYSSGVERLKEIYTYDAEGVIITVQYQYSADSGATWNDVGTVDFTYDAEGYMTHATWR